MRSAKDSASKPIVTGKALQALEKVNEQTWNISYELGHLKEADLKGFVHQIQKRHDMEDPLKRAIITVAERKLEKLERHRTGHGKWFALVQALKWDPADGTGEMKILASAECETRPAAVSMARQLLAEHLSELGEDTTIEGKVVSELDDEAEGLSRRSV